MNFFKNTSLQISHHLQMNSKNQNEKRRIITTTIHQN
jgi:hypothetical protein